MADQRTGQSAEVVSGAPARGVSVPARHFSDEEVARILRTAADLQERSAAPGQGGRLTLEDLRQIAAEAGIDPRYVDMAATDSQTPAVRESSTLAGGDYSWSVHRTVYGEVAEEDRDRVVRAIRSVIRAKGELEDMYGRMEWSYNDGLGPIMVGLVSRDGMTEIDVSARRSEEVGLWYGLVGIPFGGALGGAAVASVVGVSGAPAVLPIVGLMAVTGWGGLRFLWSRLSKAWESKVNRLADAVAAAAQEVAVAPPSIELGAPDPVALPEPPDDP